ncbi:MAG: hypothetical protein EBU59_07080, partial [Planctomycetia bacterium]|nr:hypothetical protein [Planctomycetia bacterium]
GVSIGVGAATGKGTGGALSVGVSLAYNTINIDQESFTSGSTLTTNTGSIDITAVNTAAIDAVSVAASVAAGYASSGSALALSGGGAEARNLIQGKTNSFATNSTLTSADAVSVTTTSTTSVSARVIAASASLAIATTKSAGSASVGASRATNSIGSASDKPAEARAYLENTSVSAAGALTVAATTDQTIDASVSALSAAISIGKSAIGLSGAGAETINTIKVLVEGSIDGNGTGISAGSIAVTAIDSSRIDTFTGAASVAVAIAAGNSALSLSIAVALAENTVDNDVRAAISNANQVTSAGTITVDAQSASRDTPTPDFTSVPGEKNLRVGDTVLVTPDHDAGGEPGRIYEYRGFTADFDAELADFSKADEVQLIGRGDTVKVDGRIYRYADDDDGGITLDLSAIDFADDDDNWEQTTGSALLSWQSRSQRIYDGMKVRSRSGLTYEYIGDDDGKRRLNLANEDYTDDDRWEPADVGLHTGNVIKTGSGASTKYYKYLDEDDDVDLSTARYTDTTRWKQIAPDTIDLGFQDFTNTRRWKLADGSVTATSVAASLAASVSGKAGIAVSGAGAVSRNVILTRTNAFIDASSLTDASAVTVTSANTARINATVAAVSIAVGVGGKAGVGASIGVSLAENYIGWTAEDIRSPAEVQAFIRNSVVQTTGELTVKAENKAAIDSWVLAGSAAIAGGGKAGVGLSGAGVSATNKIATNTRAFIDGDGLPASGPAIRASEITLQSHDSGSVTAFGGAATIAAAFGGKAGVALSVGVSLAQNHISNHVEAFIRAVDGRLESSSGDVVIDAKTVSKIESLTFAASLAIGGGGMAGIAVSGAGAVARNIILSRTNAFVDDGSLIITAGNLDIDSNSNSTINANVIAASAAIGLGGTAGIGASVGVAIARNFIGVDPTTQTAQYTTADVLQTIVPGTTVKALSGPRKGDVYRYIGSEPKINFHATSTNTSNVYLQNNDDQETRVKVVDPLYPDDPTRAAVYVWQGDNGVTKNLSRIARSGYDGYEDEDGDWQENEDWRLERAATLEGEDFGNPELWQLVLPEGVAEASQVQAYVKDSSVSAAGSLTLDAEAEGEINAITFAGSVAAAAGGTVGIALGGAGVGVENRGRTLIRAFIDGDGQQGIDAADITLTAVDNTRITADAAAVALAGSAAGVIGFSIAVGISTALNEIDNTVDASISNTTALSTTGDITVSAQTLGGDVLAPTYTTETATTKIKLEAGDTVRLADDYAEGGEAGRVYRYRGFDADYVSTNGRGDPDTDEDDEETEVQAHDPDDDEGRYGTTVRVARGHRHGGVVGGFYEWIDDDPGDSTDVDLWEENFADTSRWKRIYPDLHTPAITDYSDTELWELADGTITARVGAAALSGALSGVLGGAISGAGAVATNIILSKTTAGIHNSNTEADQAVSITATNSSRVVATVVAASAAIGVGAIGGAGLSIGAAISQNLIGYDQTGSKQKAGVFASITNSSVTAGNALSISATATETIDAFVLAGSVAVAGGSVVGLAGSGAGVNVVNKIGHEVKASIDGDSRVSENSPAGITATSISLLASDSSSITAEAGAVSVAVSIGLTGAAIAVGVATATNEMNNAVLAQIDNAADVRTTAGDVTLTAEEIGSITSNTYSSAAAAAISAFGLAAAAGITTAENILNGDVEASINDAVVSSFGNVMLSAADTSTVSAEITSWALSAGLVSIAVGKTDVKNEAKNRVLSAIRRSQVTAAGTGGIKAHSSANPTINSESVVGAIAFGLGGSGAAATSEIHIESTTSAFIDSSSLNASSGVVEFKATSTSSTEPTIKGLSAGLVSVSDMTSNATIGGSTSVWLEGTTTIAAQSIDLTADDTATAAPVTTTDSGGAIDIVSTNTLLAITRETATTVKAGSDITVGTSDLNLLAKAQTSGIGDSQSKSFSAIGISDLVVDSTVDSTTLAEIAGNATIRSAGGNVTVRALATDNNAKSTVSSLGVGALSVQASTPKAVVTATTRAGVEGEIVGIGQNRPGNIEVLAQANDRAEAASLSLGGGLISVQSSTVTAETTSTIAATIGGRVESAGTVSVTANGRSDADTSSLSIGVGAVDVKDLVATSTVTPAVTAKVNASATVEAAGDVIISAEHGQTPPEYSDGTFDAPTAISTTDNTIDFGKAHGLRTGDTIGYDAEGNTAIGGVETGRTYGVIVDKAFDAQNNEILPTKLQLGISFGSTITSRSKDSDGKIVETSTEAVRVDEDTIRFATPHNFLDGDRVTYSAEAGAAAIGGLNAGSTYTVKWVDAYTIKLQDNSFSTATQQLSGANVDGTGLITATGHGFADAQPVTYRAPAATTFGVLAIGDPTDTSDGANTAEDTIEFGRPHGFVAGDELIYSSSADTVSGLINGSSYFVIKVSDTVIKLAESADKATGGNGQTVEPLPIGRSTASNAAQTTHAFRKPSDQALGGLVDGRTYYVRDVSTDSFRLAETTGGTAVIVGGSVNSVTLTGQSTLGTEGVDLSDVGSGNHRLVLDLTT